MFKKKILKIKKIYIKNVQTKFKNFKNISTIFKTKSQKEKLKIKMFKKNFKKKTF